ncbi:glyoxalase superfamily protein [Luteimonas salinilitoris]|uniref:Glyoxalase superfamily protein n=1 Tax=Luteimonas salinilitoris TaxID=3237697 RepID=A0ABV4HZL9_9GAMM
MANTKLESVSPSFAVSDLPQALQFYQETLGFDVAWTWGEPADLASVCRDAVAITLAKRADARPSGTSRAYLQVTGINDLYTRVEQAGANIVVPIGDRTYGMRDFGIADPFGNRLDFGEPLAEA